MSAESKSKIIDRLNRTGRFADPKYRQGVSIDSRISQVARSIGGPPVPGAYDPGVRKFDPKNPTLTITNQSVIPFRDVLANVPTDGIYTIIEVCQEILATRTDAKR